VLALEQVLGGVGVVEVVEAVEGLGDALEVDVELVQDALAWREHQPVYAGLRERVAVLEGQHAPTLEIRCGK
jgi:hypothetical protein